MEYSLAKELKDAGFPQIYHTDEQGRRTDFREPEVVALPYLHELIEACGEHFGQLKRTSRAKGGEKWWASNELELVVGTQVYGPTPEEAVARLWLALNAPEKEAPLKEKETNL